MAAKGLFKTNFIITRITGIFGRLKLFKERKPDFSHEQKKGTENYESCKIVQKKKEKKR